MINFDKNKKFRRFIIGWVMCLITVFLTWAFIKPPDIPAKTAEVLLAIIGLLTIGFGFYQWHRKADEDREDKKGGSDDKGSSE